MEKETVIIRLRASIDFGQETMSWLNHVAKIADHQKNDNGIWFAREGGKYFLSESQGYWRQALTEEAYQTIQNYFPIKVIRGLNKNGDFENEHRMLLNPYIDVS